MNTSRLRKYRKAAQLTQREVATLVGYASQRAYSDVELGTKRPALGTALGCSILFEATLHELFPGFAEFVERDVLARAHKLHGELKNDRKRTAAALHISDLIKRMGGSNPSE